MDDLGPGEQVVAEGLEHVEVRLADRPARERAGLGREDAGLVDRAEEREALADADQVVVPAVAGRDVDEPGVLERDEVGLDHPVGHGPLDLDQVLEG